MPIDQRVLKHISLVLTDKYRTARTYAALRGEKVNFPALVGQVLDESGIRGTERAEYYRELCRLAGRAGGHARKRTRAREQNFLDDLDEYFSSMEYIRDVALGKAPDNPDGLTREMARKILEEDEGNSRD
jgi:hypothetical protein